MLTAELRSYDVKLKSLTTTTTPTTVTDARTIFRSSTSTSETSHSSHVSNKHHSVAQLNSEYSSLPRCSAGAPPSSQEAEEPFRTHKCLNLELFAEEDRRIGVGSTQDKASSSRKHLEKTMSMEGPDLWTDGESDVELTLSIGCGSNQKKPPKKWLDPNIGLGYSKPTPTENRQLLLSTPAKPDRGEECSDPAVVYDRENLQRPGWLFQTLSLNRT